MSAAEAWLRRRLAELAPPPVRIEGRDAVVVTLPDNGRDRPADVDRETRMTR